LVAGCDKVANDMKANLQTKFFCGFHSVGDDIDIILT